jgi:hypothetical protein
MDCYVRRSKSLALCLAMMLDLQNMHTYSKVAQRGRPLLALTKSTVAIIRK